MLRGREEIEKRYARVKMECSDEAIEPIIEKMKKEELEELKKKESENEKEN